MALRLQYIPLVETLHFKVDIHLQEGNKGNQTQRHVGYELQLQPQSVLGASLVNIHKKLVTHSVNAADQVVARLGEPLLDIAVVINPEGQPVRIHNHGAIWDRWNTVREEVLATYSGEWVAAMVDKTESILLKPEAILQLALQQDWVLGGYFTDVYQKDFDQVKLNCRTHSQAHHLLSRPVLLQEQWQYQPTPSGCRIAMKGNWQGQPGDATWQGIGKKAGINPETNSAFVASITKDCTYRMRKATGWCSGYESRYTITAGSYEQQIVINVVAI